MYPAEYRQRPVGMSRAELAGGRIPDVARLMSLAKIQVLSQCTGTLTTRRGHLAVTADLVSRNFSGTGPDCLQVAEAGTIRMGSAQP